MKTICYPFSLWKAFFDNQIHISSHILCHFTDYFASLFWIMLMYKFDDLIELGSFKYANN